MVNGLLKTAQGASPGVSTTLQPPQDVSMKLEAMKCLVAILKCMGDWMNKQLQIPDFHSLKKLDAADNSSDPGSSPYLNGTEEPIEGSDTQSETSSDFSDASVLDFTLEQDNVTPPNGWKAYYAATRAIVTVNAEFFRIVKERLLQDMGQFWLNADYVKCFHASGSHLLADKAQVCTQCSWKRPYGVGLLVGGLDESGAHLYYNCPSGKYFEYQAFAIGSRSQAAKTYLERKFESFTDSSRENLIKDALFALRETLQGEKLTSTICTISVLGVGESFQVLDQETVQKLINEFEVVGEEPPPPAEEAAGEPDTAAPGAAGEESTGDQGIWHKLCGIHDRWGTVGIQL
ncbi:hypothetical protein ACS0TY_012204 [Phlomoides rotata]